MDGLYLQCGGMVEVEKLRKNECTLHRLPRSLEMSHYIRLDRTNKFKAL